MHTIESKPHLNSSLPTLLSGGPLVHNQTSPVDTFTTQKRLLLFDFICIAQLLVIPLRALHQLSVQSRLPLKPEAVLCVLKQAWADNLWMHQHTVCASLEYPLEASG
jgi:hypothetical protein